MAALCDFCFEDEKERKEAREARKCQECGGTTYHIGDCSLMLTPRVRLAPDPPKKSEFPCIVCGGNTAHARIDGDIVCTAITREVPEYPCTECKATWQHWTDCSHYVSDPRTVEERIDAAQTRLRQLMVH